MNGFAKHIVTALLALSMTSGAAPAAVQVYAAVDTSKDIYTGESFTYQIIIDGQSKPGDVDLSPLQKYNPKSAGNRDVSQTSISIINGKTSRTVVKRYVMSYMLTAEKAGLINLPSVTVTLDGRTYRTNPVQVRILRPGTTDQLELEVTLSERQCYVGQPVLMTLRFYRYVNIGDYHFNVPALNSDAFYVEEPDDESGKAKQYRVTRKGRDAVLLTVSKVLIPKYAGEIELAPAMVSADVAEGRSRMGDGFFDDFFGRTQYKRYMVGSEPAKLLVRVLPEQGRPAQFYGLVGRYTIEAAAEPTEVGVGDPITLTIKVGGGKYLKPVQWPGLEKIPELTKNFKIPSQRSSPTIEDGCKIFTQTIRANNDKVKEIPSIPLAFFDADKGKYVVAKTQPIKLDVAATKILTSADLEGRQFDTVSKEVEAIRKGLSANYEGPDVLENRGFSPLTAMVSGGYAVLWGGPLAALVLSVLYRLFTYRTAERARRRRRRKAASKAVGRLKKAGPVDAHQVAGLMKQYIGERFDRVAGSLTADDCRAVVIAVTGDAQSADRFADFIAQCEAARYASAQMNLDGERVTEVIELVRIIEKKSKK